jgi:hypothetical protein
VPHVVKQRGNNDGIRAARVDRALQKTSLGQSAHITATSDNITRTLADCNACSSWVMASPT